MKRVTKVFAGVFLLSLSISIAAQSDPRVGLKPGMRDAGVAAKNMVLVATLPKPTGFNDPPPAPPAAPPATVAPTGTPTPPGTPAGRGAPAGGRGGGGGGGLDFANSDLAFSGRHMFIGNFNGYNIYDIGNPKKPKLIVSIICPGGQGDLSVYGKLLFMSVEQTRGRIDCGTSGGAVVSEQFRGVRIFDITDVKKPKQIASVQTCRGSHTHTLLVDPNDKVNVYIYGSGTGSPRSTAELAGCSTGGKEDANTALFSIDVIQVPLAAPETAKVVNRPRIFADDKGVSGLWQGGNYGPGTQTSSETNRCHDITVYPEMGLAAGACAGNGILLDIRDPVHPVRLDAVGDKNFAFWHSATFNNDATKTLFTDEWGGGTQPRCRATDQLTWGADAIFDLADKKKMTFAGYFKMPAAQTDLENCVAHNGSLVPVPGRDIKTQAWYQGGASVFDFTDGAKAVEIAYFDRGPATTDRLIVGGYWSTYWYHGYIYGAEIARGLDVLKLTPSEFLSQNEIDAAMLWNPAEFNAQHQPKMTWPANAVVAKAYIDQLNRTKAIQPMRATAVVSAMTRADKARAGRSEPICTELDSLATELESAAAAANSNDAMRLRKLAETLKTKAASLK